MTQWFWKWFFLGVFTALLLPAGVEVLPGPASAFFAIIFTAGAGVFGIIAVVACLWFRQGRRMGSFATGYTASWALPLFLYVWIRIA
jgi:hypothetical protein